MSAETRRWSDAPAESTTITIDGTTLDLTEIVIGRGAIVGKSGSGKSNTGGVLVERVLDRGIPVLVIDTDGEYKGIKEQYNILHVGTHAACDVQITVDDARTVADIILDKHIPVILDVSGFATSDDVETLVADVARRLFDRQQIIQHPLLVVVEECHEFLPQSGTTDATVPLLKIVKRGRKQGIGICGLSQRPASVDKNFLTQSDWQVWHRLTWDNDTKVVATHLDSEYAEAVKALDDGEAFIVRDSDHRPRCIQWPRKQTPDLGNAPPIERALGSTPAHIGPTIYDAFETGEDNSDVTEKTTQKTHASNESEPSGVFLGAYRVQASQAGSETGCAQLGRPVTEYLGVDANADVSITPTTAGGQAALIATPGQDGRFVYTAYERDGRYVGVSIGIRAIRALGAKAGAQLRVEERGPESVRVVVTEEEDE